MNKKTTPPLLEIKGVSKAFGPVKAVDNVDLIVEDGEIFSLLGGSGSGKSTLLRMLAGFETPTEGQILLDGKSLVDIPAHRRPVNMMFQSYALFPHMSVEKNVAYGLVEDRVAKSEIRDRVAEVLRLVKLQDFAKRKPDQLSGGQRQRVALARALVKMPRLLLLDEPLGALDKKLREETQFELMRIQDEIGITFIVVTHDQEEAMTLSDRIAVMDQGRFRQVGTPVDVYENPTSAFTANFLGTCNMIKAVIAEDAHDHVVFDLPDFGTTTRINHGITGQEGQKVHLILRPEKLRMRRRDLDPGSSGTVLQGRITDVGYLGHMSIIKVEMPDGSEFHAHEVRATRRAGAPLAVGDELNLTWDGDNIAVVPV